MAGPVVGAVAGAVAPTVVQSATDSDGLINKAFKIVMIAALFSVLLLVIYVITLVGGIIDLGEQTILKTGLSLLGLSGFQAGGPFAYYGAALTALGAFAIRR